MKSSAAATSMLPVMKPKLPPARAIAPYLDRIDAARVYSNFGPISAEFDRRLAAHFGASERAVATVASGTLGLALALAAQDVRPGTLCVIPAWTFVASAQAACLAGLVPYFVDVDASTWALDPCRIDEIAAAAPGEVGAVMPVAPFGQPIDRVAWDRFHARTGTAVVIDAAAAFDTLTPGPVPAVVSLHATKVLGIGEGGLVLCDDPIVIQRVRSRANFGFDGKREATVPALNAKMSEYHAAIGQAALDEWVVTRAEWLAAAREYRRRLTPETGVTFQSGFGESWVSSVCVLRVAPGEADQIERKLHRAAIETRRWWGRGAHAHASTVRFSRTDLPATEAAAASTIGVPLFRDMQPADIERVVNVFATNRLLAASAPSPC